MTKKPTTRANNKSRAAADRAARALTEEQVLAELMTATSGQTGGKVEDTRRLTERLTSTERKTFPLASGLLDYFPDALALVANVSWIGNEKHNPGEALHHARGKSMDHADCIMRHLLERGGYDEVTVNGVKHRIRHSAALAWRGLALLQEELELELGLPLPRNARVD